MKITTLFLLFFLASNLYSQGIKIVSFSSEQFSKKAQVIENPYIISKKQFGDSLEIKIAAKANSCEKFYPIVNALDSSINLGFIEYGECKFSRNYIFTYLIKTPKNNSYSIKIRAYQNEGKTIDFSYSDCDKNSEKVAKTIISSKKCNGDSLEIKMATWANCCGKFKPISNYSDGVLSLGYEEYESSCDCNCNYVFRYLLKIPQNSDFKIKLMGNKVADTLYQNFKNLDQEFEQEILKNNDNDADGDGIQDKDDLCPYAFGISSYNGCPPTFPDSFVVNYGKDFIKIRIAMQCDRYSPTKSSAAQLKRIIDSLKNNGLGIEKIDIIGNTSDIVHKICRPITANHKQSISETKAFEVYKDIPTYQSISTIRTGETDGLESVTVVIYTNSIKIKQDAANDKDNDGIADKDDECPDISGNKTTKGCPDIDKDGVADKNDECPNDTGEISLNGCPMVDAAIRYIGDQFGCGLQIIINLNGVDYIPLSVFHKIRLKQGMYKYTIRGRIVCPTGIPCPTICNSSGEIYISKNSILDVSWRPGCVLFLTNTGRY